MGHLSCEPERKINLSSNCECKDRTFFETDKILPDFFLKKATNLYLDYKKTKLIQNFKSNKLDI